MILEACVETPDEAIYAQTHGANRLEVCSALSEDGLTPDLKVLKEILDQCTIPCRAMLRHRAGNFIYNSDDIKILLDQLKELKKHPIDGIVFGALTPQNEIDIETLKIISEASGPFPITFHKAIDLVSDVKVAIETLKKCKNVKSILSSGLAPTAMEGIEVLKEMHKICGPELELIVAGKVTPSNVHYLQEQIGARQFHGRKII